MPTINEGISIIQEDRFSLVWRSDLVSTSALQVQVQPTAALNFLYIPDTVQLIYRIAEQAGVELNDKWRDPVLLNGKKDEFIWDLKRLGLVEHVSGDVGRRADAQGRRSIVGEADYRPGLWFHRDLILPYAKWLSSRQTAKGKSPLLVFLEKHLGGAATVPVGKPKPVAFAFADEVDAEGLKDLETVDRLLMADGVSATERTEVLRARVDLMLEA